MSKEIKEQTNRVKKWKQFLNESVIDKEELYNFIEKYWIKHNIDGVVAPLNFKLLHNYRELEFTELYKYDDNNSPISDNYSLYFIEPYKGTTVNWILDTIDIHTLSSIVTKMKEIF